MAEALNWTSTYDKPLTPACESCQNPVPSCASCCHLIKDIAPLAQGMQMKSVAGRKKIIFY